MLAVPIITHCLTETNNKLILVMGGDNILYVELLFVQG